MAKQKGIIKIKGKIDELSFYETKRGFLVRQKGGVDGERIAKEPQYARTRENLQEFGTSASAGKLLRTCIKSMTVNASDDLMVPRLTKVMSMIKNMDSVSLRGQRNIGIGITMPGAIDLLKGFNFNANSILDSVVTIPFNVNTSSGVINMNGLVPTTHIKKAEGATHVSLRGAWARIDFVNGKTELFETNTVNLPINNTLSNVVLTPTGTPTIAGNDLFLLRVEFFQQINTLQYQLNNGAFNALCVADAV